MTGHKKIDLRFGLIALSHCVVWLLMLHLIYDLGGLFVGIVDLFNAEDYMFDEAFIVVPSMIILFYWNSNYLIPKFMDSKTWWKYLIAIVLSFVFIMFIGQLMVTTIIDLGYETNFHNDIDYFDFSLVQHLIIIGISTSLGISRIAMKNAEQKKYALAKQKIAEMKFLSTQVSPHFLFNSLNSIYSLAEEEDAVLTSNAILKLSEMMRYPFTDGMQEKVQLQKEIDFLNNYISLQKTKLGDDFPIVFDIETQNVDIEIAPLLFVPIVENAFKYGVSRNTPQPIQIKLTSTENNISLVVSNTIFQRAENISNKIGLQNLKERLELIYTDNHRLKMTNTNDQFRVELDIYIKG